MTQSDADLLAEARTGCSDAFGELWRRHHPRALIFARSYSRIASADDLVAEAFTRVLEAVREGGGPESAFRPYLLAAVRNTALGWARERNREEDTDDFDAFVGATSPESLSMEAVERSLTLTAFHALPQRWRDALWYVEVEQLPREEAAALLGLSPNALSALAFRARDALRTAWLQAHLESARLPDPCRATSADLAGFARRSLSRRETRRVGDHVAHCAHCRTLLVELDHAGSRLPRVVLVAFLGTAGAAAYEASGLVAPTSIAAAAATPLPSVPGATAAQSLGGLPTIIGVAAAAGLAVVTAVIGANLPRGGAEAVPTIIEAGPTVEAQPHISHAPLPEAHPALPPVAEQPVVGRPRVDPAPPPPLESEAPPLEAPVPPTTPMSASPQSRAIAPPLSPLSSVAPPSGAVTTDPRGWVRPSASGAGLPGAVVDILLGASVIATSAVDADGSWSIAALDLPIGVSELGVRQTSGGQTSAVASLGTAALQTPGVLVQRTSAYTATLTAASGYALAYDGFDAPADFVSITVSSPQAMPHDARLSVVEKATGRTSGEFRVPIPGW